ncbi:MAG: DUF2281 domain-containing protein [Candidatus Kapabacteria bacterium]|nr:DUF2281 domain-containing protein [Candidatus Kapabacteria bacterium]
MIDSQIISELGELPESLQLEAVHYIHFLKKEYLQKTKSQTNLKRVSGKYNGKYVMTSDFDEPLDEFKDYM